MPFNLDEQQASRAVLLSPQYEDGQPKRFIRQMTSFFTVSKNSNDSVVDFRQSYLQIHVQKRNWPYQTVIYKNQQNALTRLGFGLNLAVMMSSILRYVFKQNATIGYSTSGYIDDTLATNGNGISW